jgi:hypothetical protein
VSVGTGVVVGDDAGVTNAPLQWLLQLLKISARELIKHEQLLFHLHHLLLHAVVVPRSQHLQRASASHTTARGRLPQKKTKTTERQRTRLQIVDQLPESGMVMVHWHLTMMMVHGHWRMIKMHRHLMMIKMHRHLMMIKMHRHFRA